MWRLTFKDRLHEWHRLRNSVQTRDLQTALYTVNNFWFKAPWTAYYLHWDDQALWPNPWQLLNENIFCDVARGLGILYTITLMEHPRITSADLILTADKHTLVTVTPGKYILNWEPNQVLNNSLNVKPVRRLTLQEVRKKY